MVSRKLVLNSEKSCKIVDFINNSCYFTVFCVISRQKRVKMTTLKKRNSSFFQKIKRKTTKRGNGDLCSRKFQGEIKILIIMTYALAEEEKRIKKFVHTSQFLLNFNKFTFT